MKCNYVAPTIKLCLMQADSIRTSGEGQAEKDWDYFDVNWLS